MMGSLRGQGNLAPWVSTSLTLVDEAHQLVARIAYVDRRGEWEWRVVRGSVVVSHGTTPSESAAREFAEGAFEMLRAQQPSARECLRAGLICPKCGYSGEHLPSFGGSAPFRYLEDIVCYRKVVAFHDAVLEIGGGYETGEGYDDGTNGRLECRDCGHEFDIPAGLFLDWV